MKKYIFIILFASPLLSLRTEAQAFFSSTNTSLFNTSTPNLEFNNDPDDYPRKYYSISIGVGSRFLNTTKGDVIVNIFKDNSDELYKNFKSSIDGNYPQLGYYFAISMGKYTKLTHKLFFDYTNGTHKGGGMGYSIAWNFPFQHNDNYLIIRTGFYAMIGNLLYNLNTIDNPKSDLEILGRIFEEKKVDLIMTSDFTTLGSEVEFSYFFYRGISLFANVSYDLLTNMSSTQSIRFKPTNSENDYSGASNFPLLEKNPEVLFNGSAMQNIPTSYGKLRFSIGVSFVMNRH